MKKTVSYIVLVVGAVIIACVSAGITYVSLMKKTTTQPNVTSTTVTPAVHQAVVPIEPSIVESGVSWLSSPQQLADLKLIDTSKADPNAVTPDHPTQYYKIGTDNHKDVILAVAAGDNPSGDFILYFLKNSDASYDLLAKMVSSYRFDDKGVFQYGGGALAANVTVNHDKSYPSIVSPRYIAYTTPLDIVGDEYIKGMQTSATAIEYSSQEPTIGTMREVKQYPYGTLYTNTLDAGVTGLVDQVFILKKLDGVFQQYQYTPKLYSDGYLLNAQWKDEAKNDKDRYEYLNTKGCGIGWYKTTFAEGNVPPLVETGTLTWGGVDSYDNRDAIYEISDPNNAVLKYLYDGSDDKQKKMITYSQFLTKHPLAIIKDTLGRYLLLQNTTYGPINEGCGKPVIYLYPTKTTSVSVQVGASISQSDPVYDNGWNVVAQPNGNLTTIDGKQYDSLFWEGIGHGYYPPVNRGFVVAHADIEKSLKDQLTALGLNSKEIADFLAFWLPKMPSTPYVRLSWLNTKNMDTLAPLTVSPRPDTVIRVFLDYQGLQKPITIEPEVLTGIARHGFTLVEWGGLLQK